MKHIKRKPDIIDFFTPRRVKVINYEIALRLEKIQECELLKKENSELYDVYIKQCIALESLQKGHAKDMAEMTEALRKTNEKLAKAEADRDRYREALRRTFPKGVIA